LPRRGFTLLLYLPTLGQWWLADDYNFAISKPPPQIANFFVFLPWRVFYRPVTWLSFVLDLVAKAKRLGRAAALARASQLLDGAEPTPPLPLVQRSNPQAELAVAQQWHCQLTSDHSLHDPLIRVANLFEHDCERLRLGVATAWREGYHSRVLTLPMSDSDGRVLSYVAWCWLADRLGARWLPGAELPNWLAADLGNRATVLCLSGDELLAVRLTYARLLVVPPTLLPDLTSLRLPPNTHAQVLLPPASHFAWLHPLARLVSSKVSLEWLLWPLAKERLAQLTRSEVAWMQACALTVLADGQVAEPSMELLFGSSGDYVDYYVQREEARLALGLPLSEAAQRSQSHNQHRAGVERRLAAKHLQLFPPPVVVPSTPAAGKQPASKPTLPAAPPQTAAQWVAEGLLPVGLSFLLSEMPTGLPAMLATMAIAVAEGKPALQRFAVSGGLVLYLTSDGSRLYHNGSHIERWLGERWPEPLAVYDWHSRFDDSGLSALAAKLDTMPGCKLLVVDE